METGVFLRLKNMPEHRIYIGLNKTDLDPVIIFSHDNATANGKKGYRDPFTGNYTFTSTSLKNHGFCCENKCRHCPYGC